MAWRIALMAGILGADCASQHPHQFAALIPIPSFLVILGILVFLITLPLTILQLVSVWRSAVNYNTANPSVYWGYAAQALVALGGLMLAVGLVGTIFRH